MSDRKSLVVAIGIIALICSGVSAGLKSFSSLLNEKLDTINQWTISNYKIESHWEIGVAGPAIVKYTLYQTKLNGQLKREVSSTVENNDTVCVIKFEETSTREKYYFDKCKMSIKK